MAEFRKIVSFEMEKAWHDRLKSIGRPTGLSVSQLIREAVYDKYLKGGEGADKSDRAGN